MGMIKYLYSVCIYIYISHILISYNTYIYMYIYIYTSKSQRLMWDPPGHHQFYGWDSKHAQMGVVYGIGFPTCYGIMFHESYGCAETVQTACSFTMCKHFVATNKWYSKLLGEKKMIVYTGCVFQILAVYG